MSWRGEERKGNEKIKTTKMKEQTEKRKKKRKGKGNK
jgi:hypothetical protein